MLTGDDDEKIQGARQGQDKVGRGHRTGPEQEQVTYGDGFYMS